MGNAISKIGEQTKDRSGISNSKTKDERRRGNCGSNKPKSDNRIIPQPVANTDTKRLNKGNTRAGSLNKNASAFGSKIALKKQNCVMSKASKTNGQSHGVITYGSDEKRKRIQAQRLSSCQSKSLVPNRMTSVPSTRRENEGRTLANDILLHTNDIMDMVDKWKREEERLQKDYEDTQQKIRVSLRQEHQAKAEAQTWRVQLEKLAHSHREKLFRQATLLRSRLRSAERQLVSTEQKVKGLATANNKLKGMIDKANEKARSVHLQNERKREEAKRELKDKLKSVEVELEHLTEKIISSGLMEESRNPGNGGNECSKRSHASQANSRQGAIPKTSEQNFEILPAAAVPTALYELSAVGIPQTYLPASYSRQMPQFSYNSYPIAVLPQSNCSKNYSHYAPKTHYQPASQGVTAYRHQHRKTDRNRDRITATIATKISPVYGHANANVRRTAISDNVFSESSTKGRTPNDTEQLTNPSLHCYINNGRQPNTQHCRVPNNFHDGNLTGRFANEGVTNEDQHINPNTASSHYESSTGAAFSSCDKCHGFSQQRLLVQQREVYNEFARARDRAAFSQANDRGLGHRDHLANNVDGSQSRATLLIKNGNVRKKDNKEAPCNCEQLPKSTSATSPPDISHSYREITSEDHNPIESSTATESASTERYDQGYFGDFERTASSLEVMKRRRIIHRRVATENRTR